MLRFADCESFVSCPGDPIKIQYHPEVRDDGTIDLIPCGKIDTDKVIDAQKEQCDINIIIRRLRGGDMSVLDRFGADPFYGDVTKFPSSYRDVLQFQIDAEKHFYDLDVDTRAKFNNDYRQFIAAYGKPEFFEKLGLSNVKEEVKTEDDT